MNDQELKEYISKVVSDYSKVVYVSLCEVLEALFRRQSDINANDIWNSNIKKL